LAWHKKCEFQLETGNFVTNNVSDSVDVLGFH
jgi:hypothetical protein